MNEKEAFLEYFVCGSCDHYKEGHCCYHPPPHPEVEPSDTCGNWMEIKHDRRGLLNIYLSSEALERWPWIMDRSAFSFGSHQTKEYFYKQHWCYAFHLLMFLRDVRFYGQEIAERRSSLHYWAGEITYARLKAFSAKNDYDVDLESRAKTLVRPDNIRIMFPGIVQ